jgi:hypothetical protein
MHMNDLDFLINRYIDGLASEHEVAQLNEILRSDAKSRQTFAEHLNLDSALAECAAGLPGKQAAIEDIVQLNQQALFSNAIAYSITAASIAVVLSLGTWFGLANSAIRSTTAISAVSNSNSTATNISSIANLVDEAGAKFAKDRGPLGRKFEPGDYELVVGVAHLRFALGAEVIFSAPARWTILDSMHVRVEQGKLRAIVPPSAKGFSIMTPDAEYIDLGTEFALGVDQSVGASDLYVFDGQVNVAHNTSRQVMEEVFEGEANRYSQGVVSSAPKMDSADFPTPNQIGLVRWQNHVERLRKAPGLIAFFPFHKTNDESVLENELKHAEHAISNGRIVGARWVSGRWPGKDSLLFDGDNERVELHIPGEFREYTITAWIKIDRLDYEMNSILNSDDMEDGDVHFQISRQGLLKGSLQGANTHDSFIGDPLPVGKWVHAAMVISSLDHTRQVYANGKLVRRGDMNRDVTIRPSLCRLGNWLPSEKHLEKRTRAFRGRMDELAIWNRALLESELRQMFEAGRQNVIHLE